GERNGADRGRTRWRQGDAGAGRGQQARCDPAGDRGRQASARMKVLALDFGSARTGVAVSDPTGVIARPLGVVERADIEQIASLARDQKVDEIVVGHPLTLRGERGEQARATERFAAALRKAVDVPVVLFDERFTTDLAQQTSAASAPEHARAAAHLLSSYLAWSGAAH